VHHLLLPFFARCSSALWLDQTGREYILEEKAQPSDWVLYDESAGAVQRKISEEFRSFAALPYDHSQSPSHWTSTKVASCNNFVPCKDCWSEGGFMASVDVVDVRKAYGAHEVIHGVSIGSRQSPRATSGLPKK
jgi:hypothetical protein